MNDFVTPHFEDVAAPADGLQTLATFAIDSTMRAQA